jgi:hypothetical protein
VRPQRARWLARALNSAGLMKKVAWFVLAAPIALLSVACGGSKEEAKTPDAVEQDAEKAGEKMEEGADKAGDKMEEAGDKVEEKTDDKE